MAKRQQPAAGQSSRAVIMRERCMRAVKHGVITCQPAGESPDAMTDSLARWTSTNSRFPMLLGSMQSIVVFTRKVMNYGKK